MIGSKNYVKFVSQKLLTLIYHFLNAYQNMHPAAFSHCLASVVYTFPNYAHYTHDLVWAY